MVHAKSTLFSVYRSGPSAAAASSSQMADGHRP